MRRGHVEEGDPPCRRVGKKGQARPGTVNREAAAAPRGRGSGSQKRGFALILSLF